MPFFSNPGSDFRTDPASFLSKRVVSGFRLNHAPLEGGRQHVYLRENTVNGQEVVTLESMPPAQLFGTASPVPIWWVPQGGCCDIPLHPGADDPRIVFTPDFSGCSLLVDQLDGAFYRVYHVTGGDEPFRREYQGRGHGLGLAGFVVFNDYGSDDLPRAFICMVYDQAARRWTILAQGQTGLIGLGGTMGGPLISLETLEVRRVHGAPVADLSGNEAAPNPGGTRHGTIPLSDG